jgi:hypothetical protein
MQQPQASGFFFSLNSFADRLRQARLCHFPRYVGEGRPGESILLCHLLRHTCIMARVEKQERSIQTSILGRAHD